MVELRDTSLSQFLKETEHANGEPLDAILLVPPLYQAQAAQHSRRRIVTLYATQQFLKLILEHDGLGVGRVLLGRQLPSPPPDSKVLIAGPAPAWPPGDRKRVVSGKRVSVSVGLGCSLILKKKT